MGRKRSERIRQFGVGIAGRRNSSCKGPEACYRNSKSLLWAPSAEWEVCVLFCLTGGRVGQVPVGGTPGLPSGLGARGGGKVSFTREVFLICFPILACSPVFLLEAAAWAGGEGTGGGSRGEFSGGISFPAPWRPPLTPAKDSNIPQPRAVLVLNVPLSKTGLTGTSILPPLRAATETRFAWVSVACPLPSPCRQLHPKHFPWKPQTRPISKH